MAFRPFPLEASKHERCHANNFHDRGACAYNHMTGEWPRLQSGAPGQDIHKEASIAFVPLNTSSCKLRFCQYFFVADDDVPSFVPTETRPHSSMCHRRTYVIRGVSLFPFPFCVPWEARLS